MTSQLSPMDTNSILDAIARLRACTNLNILSQWRFSTDDLSITEVMNSDFGQSVELNAKEHIAWTGGQQVIWLVQRLVIPDHLEGYPLAGLSLRLALNWWADAAEIFVNGKLVQAGDLFDAAPRVLIHPAVVPGAEFVLALRLVSPGHCDGALVRSLLVYEATSGLDPGFVADEVAILQNYLEVFAPEKLPILAAAVAEITSTDEELLKFHDQLHTLHPTHRTLSLLGHAHLDLAWLWPVSETWNAAQSTFESALSLQDDFPELIFCHSTPALYAWIEENRPDLFTAIQQKVKDHKWEVVGGFWVEPELNLIAGESLVRQLLYGQQYTLEKFGHLATVVWVPDSFGFCATLPQFMQQAGIEYFVTQKLRWNDTTKFPHEAFWWRSPDGSEIFSYMSAAVGESVDPVKMATYATQWQTQTGLTDALWLPGVGDHGGGPTRDMLEVAQRWTNSPLFPKMEFTTAESYLQKIRESGGVFPVWDSELYLEFHRGCYTTHADQKRWNRQSEGLLYCAELFASLASISTGMSYPHAELEAAWKKVLFNQFHDILPGSSITQVYVDALPEWREVRQVGQEILQQSLRAIASQIVPTPPYPDAQAMIVFNPCNWRRSEVVTVVLPESENEWHVCNTSGEEIKSQVDFVEPKQAPSGEKPVAAISFLADIPSVGYCVFWLRPEKSSLRKDESTDEFVLENEHLRVTVNPQTGDLESVFDKINQREVLSGPGNQLQAFSDSGQYWDAWNIDPNYSSSPLPPTELVGINWRERGLLQRLRVVRKIGQSTFWQDYVLSPGSAVFKIQTMVDWQERQVLVKAAFPLNLEADFATYEIPCGVIKRATKSQTAAEAAKWEVSALNWADLSGDDYGVSLLNDCKYGYDSQPNQLRLTLLRSPNWPDPEADKGEHEFTYALYPHAGSWQAAQTVQRGYELNLPLQVMLCAYGTEKPTLPEEGSLLDLGAENLVLMALKRSQDNKQWIIRCYESLGETANITLTSDLGLALGEPCDLLERDLSEQLATIKPWKIVSFAVTLADSPRRDG